MNSFSTFSGMFFGNGGKTNVNSFNYINSFAKSLTVDFSGNSVTDLSATSSYAPMACGININNNNTTFARLKYGANYLSTSDFNTGSFTFYVKHAARYSNLPPFNIQNPNLIRFSQTGPIMIGSTLNVNFYSTLSPGTSVPYLITGCTSANLTNASLSGNFVSPYTVISYTIFSGGGSTITFNVSGGLSASISIYRPPVVLSTITRINSIINGGSDISDNYISTSGATTRSLNPYCMVFSLSPSGKNMAIKYWLSAGSSTSRIFISTNYGVSGSITFLGQYFGSDLRNIAINDTDQNHTWPQIFHTIGRNDGGLDIQLCKSDYTNLNNFINYGGNGTGPTNAIIVNADSNGNVYCIGYVHRTGWTLGNSTSATYNVASFPTWVDGTVTIYQMSHTHTMNYVLMSYLNGTNVNFKLYNITSGTTYTSFIVKDSSLTNISSSGNGLVYVSKTGLFMAICTNLYFYYSTDKFVTTLKVDITPFNIFFSNFSNTTLNSSNWLAYSEISDKIYFLKTTTTTTNSMLCAADKNFTNVDELGVTVNLSIYPAATSTNTESQCVFVSSKDAEYILLYGTYQSNTGLYYIKT